MAQALCFMCESALSPGGATYVMPPLRGLPKIECGCEEILSALRAGQFQPDGAVVGLDDELEAQKEAARALQLDELSQLAYPLCVRRQAVGVAVRQLFDFD